MSLPTPGHQFAAAVSHERDPAAAADQLLAHLADRPDRTAQLMYVFASHHYLETLAELVGQLRTRLPAELTAGCLGESIVTSGREFEQQPAVSIWLAWLPEVEVVATHMSVERTPEGVAFAGMDHDLPEHASVLLLAEPFSFPADVLLERWSEDRPGAAVIGGMASGATAPGANRLILNDRLFDHGAVAVALDGPLTVRPVVSQGCRPIGRPLVVTHAERNLIHQLGGVAAMEQLQRIFDELPNQEKLLVNQGLHLGCVVNEYQDHFEPGDFLIRNVVGIEPQQRSLVIADYVRAGQTVQFHVRDAASADHDLKVLLRQAAAEGTAYRSALLFTCNGRGTRLFAQPHHDAQAIAQQFGDIPVAGFFAQGELGPVGGKNFLHGFTASIALFA